MTDEFFTRTLTALADPGSTYARTFDASPLLDLSIGEVRYPLPAAVRTELAEVAGQVERLWYSTPQGEPALRAAYLRHLAGADPRRGVPASTDVLVTAGGKEAAWLAIRYLLHRSGGGPALVPSPGWEPYRLWLSAAGHPQVPYDPAALAADPAALPALIAGAASRPTLLILNYPHSPTGTSVDQAGMDQIVAAAAEAGVAVVSDEVYRTFAPGPVSAALAPAFDPDRDAVVDSCSKWLGVAGLRIGFLLAGPDTIRDITVFRASYASCTSVLAQHAAAALLGSDAAGNWLTAVRAETDRNRRAVAAHLDALGVPVESDGGLYLWCRTPDPDKLADPGVRDRACISPGGGFGSPDHVRLCIARAGLDPTGAAAAVVATLREG
jgi:aspartate/methionine/tyrosine aminotransferase